MYLLYILQSESRREARSSAYKKDGGEGMTIDTDDALSRVM